MHERNLRRLLMAGFFTLCICPTLFVIAWAASHQLDVRRTRLERDLSRALALSIRLRELHFPRPHVMLLAGVTVTDPETGEELARARLIEVSRTASGRIVTAWQPAVNVRTARRLVQWFDQHLLRQDWVLRPGVTILADQVTLENGVPVETLTRLRSVLVQRAAGPEFRTVFGVARRPGGEASQVRVVRNRQQTPPATAIELDAKSALPCALLGQGLAEQLGTRATFRGKLLAIAKTSGWEFQVKDTRWTHVDLDRMVSDHSRHRLSGVADVKLDHARVENGRLVQGQGTLVAGPGYVSSSLLAAASTKIPLRHRFSENDSESAVRYEKLAFDFNVDSQGPHGELRIQGHGPAGTIMSGPEGDLLREPSHQPLPLAGGVAWGRTLFSGIQFNTGQQGLPPTYSIGRDPR